MAASVSYVQNSDASSGGADVVAITLSSATTSGNTLIGCFALPLAGYVMSVTDSQGNPWIQAADATSTGGNCEIWYARGIHGGSTTVTATLSFTDPTATWTGMPGIGLSQPANIVPGYTFSVQGNVGFNCSEWNNLYYRDPLDQWSANFGTSSTPTINTLTPRQNGDLFIGVQSGASVTGPPSGWTALAETGGAGYGAAYFVNSASTATTATWPTSNSATWAVAAACFTEGSTALNPRIQFPETLVEISTTNNFLAPLEGVGVWTNISRYFEGGTLGPLGRQHELDRVQATPSQMTFNNRGGEFNPWNTAGFLYNGGLGLKPMNPIKVTAAWLGITDPVYYGYLQSVSTVIQNVVDIDAQLNCVDILQIMSLKYLSSGNYAQLVAADGGANLAAYYRLGDQIGSNSVLDSSGNNYTGSLINGQGGEPAFGTPGAFLYDADTACDLTNGTNLAGGGITTANNATQPPTQNDPLGAANVWSFEAWLKWTGETVPAQANMSISPSVAAVPNAVLFGASQEGGGGANFEFQAGYFVNPQFGNSILICTSELGAVFPLSFESNLFDGNWHHLVVAASVTAMSVYLDGNAPTIGSVPTGLTWEIPADITIGSPAEGATGFAIAGDGVAAVGFSGTLDEIALYSTALTQAQAANHYATGLWFQSEEYGASDGPASAGRLNKVLEVVGLNPSTILSVPYQFKTLLYAETNPVTTVSALNYMQTTTETEPGLIFQGPNGMVNAYNRQYQYLNPTSTTSQAVFADSASVSFHYNGPSLQISGDDLDVWNDIQVQSGRSGSQLQEWGPTQSNAAAQSASVYGARTMQGLTSLQQQNDGDGLALAQNYIAWYANPLVRVAQMQLNSFAAGGAMIPQMLGRGLYDRITVQYQGQAPGSQFSQDSLIEQITHDIHIADGPYWATTFVTSPYEILLQPIILGTWRFGDPSSEGVLTL